MDEFVHVTPPRSPTRAREPKRIQLPEMWTKEKASASGSGPWNGAKDPDQLVVKAEYGERVMQLDMVKATLGSYTWQALKSKVSWCVLYGG